MIKTNLAKKRNYFIYALQKNFFDGIFSLLIIAVMGIIIFNPTTFARSTTSGVKLFFNVVFPGLFPFMFLTKLLTEIGFVYKLSNKLNGVSNKLFGTSGVSIYCLLMSLLSGYPIGAKIISDLYEKNLITENEAKRLSIFCTTSGPIFIIGAVGAGMFGSIKIGAIIYFAHILSSIALGVAFNLITKNVPQTNSQNIIFQKQPNIFSRCVYETINSILAVGAYITIFFLLAELFDTLHIFDFLAGFVAFIFPKLNTPCIKPVLYSILEVTRGAKELSLVKSTLNVALCAGMISFSGISILMQEMMFLKNANIKTHKFIFTKIIHCVLTVFLCFILLQIFA